MSYPGHSLEAESYLSAEKQMVFSTFPVHWNKMLYFILLFFFYKILLFYREYNRRIITPIDSTIPDFYQGDIGQYFLKF